MNATSRCRTIFTACGMALFAADIATADPVVVPIEGDSFTATLSRAEDGKLEFTGETPRLLDLADLVRWGDFAEPKRGPLWLLADGGVLLANGLALNKDQLLGESLLFGKISLPIGALAGILVQPPGDKPKRDALVRSILAAEGSTDRVVLDNGDELSGTIEILSRESIRLSNAAGPPGEPAASATGGVTSTAGHVEVELTRVAAIVFNPSLVEKLRIADRHLVLGFSDGSRLKTQSLTADPKNLAFSLYGTEYKAHANALDGMQSFGGRVRYLSDLKELSYKHVPYLKFGWPLRKDVNVLGQPLRVRGKRFLKGLGMHTASRVAYELDGPYRQFQAELAIDDSAAGRGSAVCSLFVDDGSGKWQPKYASPIIRGGESPIPVRVALTGVKAISLLADFADHGDELDHVDWLNARLVRSSP